MKNQTDTLYQWYIIQIAVGLISRTVEPLIWCHADRKYDDCSRHTALYNMDNCETRQVPYLFQHKKLIWWSIVSNTFEWPKNTPIAELSYFQLNLVNIVSHRDNNFIRRIAGSTAKLIFKKDIYFPRNPNRRLKMSISTIFDMHGKTDIAR